VRGDTGADASEIEKLIWISLVGAPAPGPHPR
jgi:hypothetical protein